MKINTINFVIAFAISALVSLWFWNHSAEALRYMIAIGVFWTLGGTLGLMIGVTYSSPRTAINLRVVCAIFLVIALAFNEFSAVFAPSLANYLIISVLALLLFFLTFRAVSHATE